MNADLIYKRAALFLWLLSICLLLTACGKRQAHVLQAESGAKNGFSFGESAPPEDCPYILNVSSARIHRKDCRYVETVKEEHRLPVADTKRATQEGYRYCSVCFPREGTDETD